MESLKTLDRKDKKILYELDKNARISFTQLGKKANLSKETTYYRVSRLEEQGIIKGYQTAVNYSKLGLIHFKVCLRFTGIPIQTEEATYSELNKIPQIIWIAKCLGDWDCMISCTVNDIAELEKIKDKILGIAGDNVLEKSISILTGLWSFPRNYLLDREEETRFKTGGKAPKSDELDLKILRTLAKDARKPIVDIANEAKSTVRIVTLRFNKLLKSGIINNFRLIIDYDKLGLNFYKTFIYLKKPDEKRLKQLMTRLNINPNVIHNIRVIGDWDLEPEFEFEKKDSFRKAIQELMDEFSDIIQKISVIEILKEYKFTFFYK